MGAPDARLPEADARGPGSESALAPLPAPTHGLRLQRRCACADSAAPCSACAAEAAVPGQRDADPGSAPQAVTAALSADGQALDQPTRRAMEAGLGHRLDGVRIHVGERASAAALSVGALAYTVGRDIVFGAGQYRPDTAPGRHLLAHELAHVVQQSRGGPPGGAHEEREADGVATALVAGRPASVQRGAAPGLQREEASEAELRRLAEATAKDKCQGGHCHRSTAPPDLWAFAPPDRATIDAFAPPPPPASSPQAATNAHTSPAAPSSHSLRATLPQPDMRKLAAFAAAQQAQSKPAASPDQPSAEEIARRKAQWEKDYALSQRTPPFWSLFDPSIARNPARDIKDPLLRAQSETADAAVRGQAQLGGGATAIAAGVAAAAVVLAVGALSLPAIGTLIADAAVAVPGVARAYVLVVQVSLEAPQLVEFAAGKVLQIGLAGGIVAYLNSLTTAEGALGLIHDVLFVYGSTPRMPGGSFHATPEEGAGETLTVRVRAAPRTGRPPSTNTEAHDEGPTTPPPAATTHADDHAGDAPPVPPPATHVEADPPPPVPIPPVASVGKTPADAGQAMRTRYQNRLIAPPDALEDIIARARASQTRVDGRAAASELRDIVRLLDGGEINGVAVTAVEILPPTTAQRTPDLVVHLADGTVTRVEIRSLTSAPRGLVDPKPGPGGIGRSLADHAATTRVTPSTISQAIIDKARVTPTRPSQLTVPLPGVSPGGTISVNVTSAAVDAATVDAAVAAAAPRLGAHAERIEVGFLLPRAAPTAPQLRGTRTYVRQPNGTYRFMP